MPIGNELLVSGYLSEIMKSAGVRTIAGQGFEKLGVLEKAYQIHVVFMSRQTTCGETPDIKTNSDKHPSLLRSRSSV